MNSFDYNDWTGWKLIGYVTVSGMCCIRHGTTMNFVEAIRDRRLMDITVVFLRFVAVPHKFTTNKKAAT